MSYDNIGLNSLLQANDSLAAGSREFTSSVDFDTGVDLPTNYIGSANIRNFNFSQGSGGTLTLGGTLNGDGVLSVLNNSAGTVVSLNSSGITVNNGSIVINNNSGSLSYDGTGVVSITNFVTTDAATGGANQNFPGTAGTAEIDVTNASLSVVLPRPAYLLCMANVNCYHIEGGGTQVCSSRIYMSVNGTKPVASEIANNPGDVIMRTMTTHYCIQVGAGTNTLKLSATVDAGAGTATMTIYDWRLAYVKIGT